MVKEVRYWERLGIYVTRDFAEEYIERSQDTGITGEYLDTELEEYEQITTISPYSLSREVEEIFSQPYVSVDLPPESQVMLDVIKMETDKKSIIKERVAEGLSMDEAKAEYTATMNTMVADVLGIKVGGAESDDTEATLNEEE